GKQFRRTDTGKFIGVEQMRGCVSVAKPFRKAGYPVGPLPLRVTVWIPPIAGPGLVPYPVAISLLEQRYGVVGRYWPIPVAERIHMDSADADALEVENGLTYEVGVPPTEWF